LKNALGQHVTVIEELPPLDEEGKLILIPEDVLEVREKKLRNKSIKKYLFKWKNSPIEDASWEGEQVVDTQKRNIGYLLANGCKPLIFVYI
jgi:hypothetical protein